MKNKIKTITIAVLTCFAVSFIASCYAPSPLYGTWADNIGNKITFTSDGSFNATVTINGTKEQSMGTYLVLKNILTFTRESGTTTSTEWDIRGNILYLNWVDSSGSTKQIQLFKISN